MIFLNRNVILQLSYKSHQGSPFFVGSWLELYGYWLWIDAFCTITCYSITFIIWCWHKNGKQNVYSRWTWAQHQTVLPSGQVNGGLSLSVGLSTCLPVCLNLNDNFSFNNVSGLNPFYMHSCFLTVSRSGNVYMWLRFSKWVRICLCLMSHKYNQLFKEEAVKWLGSLCTILLC